MVKNLFVVLTSLVLSFFVLSVNADKTGVLTLKNSLDGVIAVQLQNQKNISFTPQKIELQKGGEAQLNFTVKTAFIGMLKKCNADFLISRNGNKIADLIVTKGFTRSLKYNVKPVEGSSVISYGVKQKCIAFTKKMKDASVCFANLKTKKIIQYFGIFNDGPSADSFHDALKMNPPFDKWDITYIAFAHTHLNSDDKPYLDYENNKRMINGKEAYPDPNDPKADNDHNRIKELIAAAREVNPDMKFVISLGYYAGDSDFTKDRQKVHNDIGAAAKDPDFFADSVIKFLKDNDLDGLDVDYENGSSLSSSSDFKKVFSAIRKKLNDETTKTGRKYILCITAATTRGFDADTINNDIDYVGAQGYNFGSRTVSYPTMENNILGENVDTDLLVVGMNIEGSDDAASKDRVNDFLINKNAAGIFGWRVNCANQMKSNFSGVIKMAEIMQRDTESL